jgi:ATP-binding cassette, subfamily F, member 3
MCFCVFFSRSLQLPSHISVLHVEQEVVGDATLALDSVLECDITRSNLLEEEKLLTAKLNGER